ncbi:low temperature requirement protein A [Cryobacterium algoricola]|uniref:Low temperature requirement protein A n=1 Tax=Cryobacterium algoricola TaxID=1259183 RepID=A0ABY2ICU4_9MICO|nr:low temperature requirement protein A [Cryobacterium algoricola]TFB85260.1 low temperature requirement protein A [Cryobacterium algoricola]
MSISDGHYRHGLRRVVGRRTDEQSRAATPLELLFDLTFVAAFGVAGNQLAHGTAIGQWQSATVAFLFAMFSVVWAWINVTWFASGFDNDDWLYRLLTLVQMTGVIVLAIGLPPLFASIESGDALDNRLMVAGYVIMRVALILQWFRAVRADSRYRPAAVTYAVFVGGAQIGWLLLAALQLHALAGLAVALVLFGIEALGPVVAEGRGARDEDGSTPWHPHHLAERFALLTIIALGETVFGTLASATEISDGQGWTLETVVVVGAGIALSFSLWWTYFLVPHALALEARREKTLPWGYAHVFLYAAIAAVGAGLHVIGYAHETENHLNATTVVASIGIPVVVFALVRDFLQAWLVSARPPSMLLQISSAILPVAAIGLAAANVPVWVCLIVVLASPLSIIVWFELGGWRSLDTQLAQVAGGAGRPGPARPG